MILYYEHNDNAYTLKKKNYYTLRPTLKTYEYAVRYTMNLQLFKMYVIIFNGLLLIVKST